MEQVEVRNETVGEVAVCEVAVCEVAVSEVCSDKELSESGNEVAVSEGAVSRVKEELNVCMSESLSSSSESSSSSTVPLKYKRCLVCEEECSKRIKRCKSCKGGLYCSRKCRNAHAEVHQELCQYIVELEKIESEKSVVSFLCERREPS